MIILKRITIDEKYDFELRLDSKSLHAHSLMCDFKEEIKDKIENVMVKTLRDLKEFHRR